jgi:hypothetical protein
MTHSQKFLDVDFISFLEDPAIRKIALREIRLLKVITKNFCLSTSRLIVT